MHSQFPTHRLAFAAAVSLFSFFARGESYTWLEGGTTPWPNTLSWDPMGVPTAGDSVTIPGGCTVPISGINTAGQFELGNVTMSGSEPNDTLRIDTGDGSDSAFHARKTSSIGTIANDPNLSVLLANPTSFHLYPGGDAGDNPVLYIHAKLTGGTEEAPIPVTFFATPGNWKSAKFFLTNYGNDFRGDIYISGNSSTAPILMCGFGNTIATDSLFGHPDNVIHVNSKATLALHRMDENGIRHKVVGCGTLQATNYDAPNNNFLKSDLSLGDGFILDPQSATSPYATFSIRNDWDYNKTSGILKIDPNATFCFDVSPNASDMVNIRTYDTLNLCGNIVITEQEPITPGSTFTLFSIIGGEKAVSWNPTSVTEGYSYTLVGNKDDGWTVTATKLRMGANVTTLSAFDIGDTFATTLADITAIVPAGAVTLRTYYGTTDGGNDPNAWDFVATYPSTDLAEGTHPIVLTGLTEGVKYYFRHSVENSVGENFASESVSFTTQALTAPNLFTWVATNDHWSTEGVWALDAPLIRSTPGLQGDIIRIITGGNYGQAEGHSRTITLDDDVTIKALRLPDGYGCTVTFTAPDAPATLTFDSGDLDVSGSIEITGSLNILNLGTSFDDLFAIHLHHPLHLLRTTAWGLEVNLWAPISGGTEESPTPIFAETQSSVYCNLYLSLLNPQNAWVGDMTIGSHTDHQSTSELRVGNANIPSVNSMLGDPANSLYMGNHATVRFYAPADTAFNLERTIGGTGTIYGNIHNNALGSLHLTESACLAPCGKTGTGFGSITVRAATLTFDPAATIAVDLGQEGNDTVVFESTSGLTLSAHFTFSPDYNPVAPGTTWPIATVQKAPSLSLEGLTSPGYRVYAEQDLEATTPTYLLFAEKLPDGTLLLLR